jgi:hypothetical protein
MNLNWKNLKSETNFTTDVEIKEKINTMLGTLDLIQASTPINQ